MPYGDTAMEVEAVTESMADKVPKRLVITSVKGGCSKTTTTRNLAVAAAFDGLKVATLDLDPQQTLTAWHDRRPDNAVTIANFSALLRDVDDIDDIRGFDIIIVDTPPLVTSGIRSDDTNSMDEADKAILRHLRKLVTMADFVLVPSFQQEEDIVATESWLSALRLLGTKSACLLSATNRRTKSFIEAKHRLIRAGRLCPMDIPRVEDIPTSTKLGLGVIELGGAKGSDDFKSVWAFLKTEIGL